MTSLSLFIAATSNFIAYKLRAFCSFVERLTQLLVISYGNKIWRTAKRCMTSLTIHWLCPLSVPGSDFIVWSTFHKRLWLTLNVHFPRHGTLLYCANTRSIIDRYAMAIYTQSHCAAIEIDPIEQLGHRYACIPRNQFRLCGKCVAFHFILF